MVILAKATKIYYLRKKVQRETYKLCEEVYGKLFLTITLSDKWLRSLKNTV